MNDPKRLLLGDASARERALLSAGAEEEPPPDGAARLAAALGLPQGTATSGPPDAVPAPPPAAVGVGSKLGAKWLLLAGAAVAAVSGVVLLINEPAPEASRSLQQNRAATSDDRELPAPVPRTGDPALPSRESSSIAGEIAQLEQVRALWRARESEQALAELRRYEARYQQGALREEAEYMRIELLVQTARESEARPRAEAFLRAYPEGVHSERVRALAEQLGAR